MNIRGFIMGRSVSTPSNCSAICYQDGTEIEDEFDFNDFRENVEEEIKSLYPSMDNCNKWIGREDHAIMENKFAYIGISEYCGLIAIWVKSKGDEYEGTYYAEEARLCKIADAWCDRITPSFDKAFSQYRRIGTASNGESFFEKIA
jgi:hypothetical protein